MLFPAGFSGLDEVFSRLREKPRRLLADAAFAFGTLAPREDGQRQLLEIIPGELTDRFGARC